MAAQGQKGRTVAFFDFDGTLAARDSLWPFLIAARGRLRCAAAAAFALGAWVTAPQGQDRRTVFKETLLRHTLGGLSIADLRQAVSSMRDWPRWLEPTFSALKSHHAAGHCVVIATGSLDLYVPTMLKDFVPYDDLLCTEMESADGVLTGRMKSGNCARENKAERVAAYIAANGPFADSWAYGNAPHDLPMMDLVKNRVVV